jgi:hypothetical protein
MMKNKTLLCLCLLFICLFKTYGQSWLALDSGIDVDTVGTVYCMAPYNGSLYAGGRFMSAGNSSAINIASWNGSAWSAVGRGVGRPDIPKHISTTSNTVYAMAVYNNELYVAGVFDSAGGVPAKGLAKWNGAVWSSVVSDTGYGTALTVYNGKLYVAGNFASQTGCPQEYLCSWDGNNWVVIDTFLVGDFFFTGVNIASLAVYNNTLIVAGAFGGIGNNQLQVNNIAAWNGTQWDSLSTGVGTTTNNFVSVLANINNALYAGGGFSTAGGVTANSIASWNGSQWSALDHGVSFPNNFYIVYGLCTDNNGNLVAGGSFTGAGNTPVNNIAMWDGSSWSPLGLGIDTPGQISTLCNWNNNIYAGGNFIRAGTVSAINIAEWTSATGLQNLSAGSNITIYPNPADNKVLIQNLEPGASVTVSDILGHAITHFIATSATETIDIAPLSAGTYFVNGTAFVKK